MCHRFQLILAVLSGYNACAIEPDTAYNKELAEIDAGIASFQKLPPPSATEFKRSLHFFYRRAALTSGIDDIKGAEAQIEKGLNQFGPLPDFYLVRANLELKLHQLAKAKSDLAKIAELTADPALALLQADIALQEGRHAEAIDCCKKSIHSHPSWDGFARLAWLNSLAGDLVAAQENYLAAEDEITAKEMRSYAWVELQRGLLEFNRGNFPEARAHYERANKAYSGYWLTEGCLAEVDAAQGQFQSAIARYETVIARAPRPEIQQALGDLYVFTGKNDRAKPWHDKALESYLESARRGEVHYYHHLAAFFADVRPDSAEAIKWARADLELRHNFAAFDALAWALYRDGQFTEALGAIDKALCSRVKDAHLFFHPAMIHLAAGRTAEGRQFLQQAGKINPRYENFHVHR